MYGALERNSTYVTKEKSHTCIGLVAIASTGSTIFTVSGPMWPSSAQDAPASSSSSWCLALAWHVCCLCVLHVALVLSSVAAAALVVVLLPFACTAASLCLVCAITARLLSCSTFFAPEDRTARRGGGGSDDDVCSCEEEEEEHGDGAELGTHAQGCAATYVHGVRQFSDPYGDEQDRQFFLVDTGNYYYCKKFYDLLAFWRRKERASRR